MVDSEGVWDSGCVCTWTGCRGAPEGTYRYAGLRHRNAVRVGGGFHALVEGGGEAVRLVGTLAPAPLGTAGLEMGKGQMSKHSRLLS